MMGILASGWRQVASGCVRIASTKRQDSIRMASGWQSSSYLHVHFRMLSNKRTWLPAAGPTKRKIVFAELHRKESAKLRTVHVC